MEDKIIEVFKKYSKSVDTEYNVYNCLIEEDWSNIAQEVVKLFRQPAVVGRSEQLVCPNCDGEGFSGKGTNEILPCLSCFGSGEKAD